MQWKDSGSNYNTTQLTQYFQFSLLLCLTHCCVMQQITCYLIPLRTYFDAFIQVTYAFVQNSTPVFNNIASLVSVLIAITAYVASLATLIATFGRRPLWAVACNVPRLVAVIARATGSTTKPV